MKLRKQKLEVLHRAEFVVYGEPKSKLRKTLGVTWNYNPKTKKSVPRPTATSPEENNMAEEAVRQAFFKMLANPRNKDLATALMEKPWERYVASKTEYYAEMNKTQLKQYGKKYDIIYNDTTPDGDNLDKLVWDGLEKILFKNDMRVVKWNGTKYAWKGLEKSVVKFLLLGVKR